MDHFRGTCGDEFVKVRRNPLVFAMVVAQLVTQPPCLVVIFHTRTYLVESVRVVGPVVREAAIPEYVKTDDDPEECGVIIRTGDRRQLPPLPSLAERYAYLLIPNLARYTL